MSRSKKKLTEGHYVVAAVEHRAGLAVIAGPYPTAPDAERAIPKVREHAAAVYPDDKPEGYGWGVASINAAVHPLTSFGVIEP